MNDWFIKKKKKRERKRAKKMNERPGKRCSTFRSSTIVIVNPFFSIWEDVYLFIYFLELISQLLRADSDFAFLFGFDNFLFLIWILGFRKKITVGASRLLLRFFEFVVSILFYSQFFFLQNNCFVLGNFICK